MSDLFQRRLSKLAEPQLLAQLTKCQHGIEREALRARASADLSMTAHPPALGAAMTHPSITTDYAEPLLEFVTGAHSNASDTLRELEEIHRFTHSVMGSELLWSSSMPCRLPFEEEIPIARYGSSNEGKFRYLYRLGLALRYGKTMQCIAGIHYNFSVAPEVWSALQQLEGNNDNAQDYQSDRYVALIRNFRRYRWLLMYLFGASPALDKSFFLHQRAHHNLQEMDEKTLYLPYATSLRLSDFGYRSQAQASIVPCYNNLKNYTDSLLNAVSTRYPAYVALGTHDKNDNWQQINTSVLQIANEYYSSIRPKRVAKNNERPVDALIKYGVEYVEARCIDVNPFLPLGIDLPQCRFLDSFLLYCALQDSPLFSAEACRQTRDNFGEVVNRGREPGLQLVNDAGEQISLVDWANQLLDGMDKCAELLDQAYGTNEHQQAIELQRNKVADVSLTPSAQVLAALREKKTSFAQLSLDLSLQHANLLRNVPLEPEVLQRYLQLAKDSIAKQKEIEQADTISFDEYMEEFYQSLESPIRDAE